MPGGGCFAIFSREAGLPKSLGVRAATSRTSPTVTYVSRCSTIDLVDDRHPIKVKLPRDGVHHVHRGGYSQRPARAYLPFCRSPSSQRGPKDQRRALRSSANARRRQSICLASPRSVTLRIVSWGTLTSRTGVRQRPGNVCHLSHLRGEQSLIGVLGPLPGAALALRTAD